MNEKVDINLPSKGLNSDAHPSNLDGSAAYTYALNARQESEDGNQLNLTNESSNNLCINFPTGTVIGQLNIPEQSKTIFWIVDGTKAHIGYTTTQDCDDVYEGTSIEPDPCDTCGNNLDPVITDEPTHISTVPCCTYTSILITTLLDLDAKYPIHEATYKITNDTVEVYWTDNHNPMRWLDINKVPMIGSVLDTNAMRVLPEFAIPTITAVEIEDSGSLKAGAYQFFVAYSNKSGEELSEYYSATNPVSIYDIKPGLALDFDTNKSIKIQVNGLDTRYKYLNLAVAKTIVSVTSFELVGTFDLIDLFFEFLYTGNDKIAKQLTTQDIFFRYPFYTKAGTVTNQENMLMWGNLEGYKRINYQSVANKIQLMWEDWRVPYTKFEAYNDGTNTSNIRGYLRDEVYAFSMVPVLRSGRIVDEFHIPGRLSLGSDWDIITNLDAANNTDDPCDTEPSAFRWQVYNTATLLGNHPDFNTNGNDPCYIGPRQYGDFGYWESIQTYPNDPAVWYELAGQKIRHHKFPDSTITHIHDNNTSGDINYQHSIYPIGVKIDINNLRYAIDNSDLTQEQKDDIIGIKIIRANRSGNNSIVAKGVLYNVGKYTRDEQTYYFPNYSLNDLGKDPFISTKKVDHRSGPNNGTSITNTTYDDKFFDDVRLDAFNNEDSKLRYTFHGPNTSFRKDALTGKLKLETVESGIAYAHLIKVQKNARYTIGTKQGIKMAVTLALTTVLSYHITGGFSGVEGQVGISLDNFLPAFNAAFDLIKKLIPFREYGYQYNAVGNYCTYKSIPETGNKIRTINLARYLQPGIFNVDDTYPVNNFQRESTVYLRLADSLPFPHDQGGSVDNSRFTFNSYKAETGLDLKDNVIVERNISAYYASIKRDKPDQYGQINSTIGIDTAAFIKTSDDNPKTIFGGDTFINRFALKRKLPFFLQNTVGQADDSDVFYNELGNVGYPTYYLSTGPISYEMSQNVKDKFDTAYDKATDTDLGTGLIASATMGMSRFIPAMKALVALIQDIVGFLGIKDVNFDRSIDKGYFEEGVMYLFSYGIPYFFVESDVNVDMRQASNTLEGNFFPNVGTGIPDNWLQETTVSIAKDNEYLYNRDYSKQNVENYFTKLPVDFDPTKENINKNVTRVIYSQKTNLEEKQNNWLVYKANDYYDFPLVNGPLVDLVGIESGKVLARFENNTSIYNAFIKIETDNKTAITGTGGMFANPPQEFSKGGYMGTQHKCFVSTKYGHFWIDAKRGEVFNLQGNEPKEISRVGQRNWLKENLPFKISKQFTNLNLDNAFTSVGLSMGWDNRFERLFVTKKDYVPLNKDIIYDEQTNQFLLSNVPVSLTDTDYFCDASWTIAYSPLTQSWVSFYSFIPDYYVSHEGFFQTGKYNSLWNHVHTNKSFQVFYNVLYPFTVEAISKPDIVSGTLTAINYRMDTLRYVNDGDWKYMKDVTFTDAIVYSTRNTSGDIKLLVEDRLDMSSGMLYTINPDNITCTVSSSDSIWKFNKFSDVTRDANSKEPIFNYNCGYDKEINPDAVDYTKPMDMMRKTRLKADWFKVRLSNTQHSRYKMIFKFLVSKQVKSTR